MRRTPPRKNPAYPRRRGGRPSKFDPGGHKARHAVECGTDRPKRHRAVATRYNKLDVRYEATVL